MKDYIDDPAKNTIPSYLWDVRWIQQYESLNGIINKFCYANNMHMSRFNQLFKPFESFDYLDKLLGISCESYVNEQNQMIYSRIGTHIDGIEVIDNENFWYCPKCIVYCYHSIFHQIILFSHCIYHKNERLRQGDKAYLSFDNRKGALRSQNRIAFINGFKEIEFKKTKLVFANWRRPKGVTDVQFQSFMDLPRHFERLLTTETKHIWLENIYDFGFPEVPFKKRRGSLCLDQEAAFLANMSTRHSIRLDCSKFADLSALDEEPSSTWWQSKSHVDQVMAKTIANRRLAQAKHMNHYFQDGYRIFRYSFWDIRTSLIHYVRKLLISHKKCISYYMANKRNNNDIAHISQAHYCFVATIFMKLLAEQPIMETRMNLIRPLILDTSKEVHRKVILNDFTRHSQYVYDTLIHEYRRPVNHIRLAIESTDAYTFRIYYEAFMRLIYKIWVKQHILDPFSSIPELRIILADKKIWFYPTIQISDFITDLLNYCNNQNLCARIHS